MSNNKEHIIRKIEEDILDQNFLNYKLITYNETLSIPHLLKVYGDIVREFESNSSIERSDFALWKSLTLFLGGLNHCIRWVVNSRGEDLGNHLTFREKDEMALEFLCWGKNYNEIAQQFVAWSRNMIEIELLEEQKVIEFLPPNEQQYYFTFLQDVSSKELLDRYVEETPVDLMLQEFQHWVKEIDLKDPPININWENAKNSNIKKLLIEYFASHILPEIDIKTDLGNYTFKEYLAFYSILYINFSFITSIEDYIDSKTNLENSFGSNPISLQKNKMINFLHEITDLSKSIVTAILRDLTFDASRFHSQLLNKPFVLSKEETFYILPRMFIRIDPRAMFMGVMTKGKKAKRYSQLINQIEKVNLDIVYNYVKKLNSNWVVLKEQNFEFKNQRISPDIIVFNKKDNEVLIIDYKNFIPPYSASDTDYKLQEANKGIKQVQKYINYFVKFSDHDKTILKYISEKFHVFAILLFKDPMPMPIEGAIDKNIILTDMNTLKKVKRDINFIREIFDQLNTPSHVSHSNKDFFYEKQETKAGDWKFIRSIYAAN